ncbi:Serine-threonine/tyrosine-protein kinase, catalytic domain [Dillenia turbinata]|uniref:Serine-threonine/tyrosine-protein kinase, catalytic domain n=1 Tax=Dillenia turbinata TaxID=194707 RepID=A0AAN8VTF0_9MAGN
MAPTACGPIPNSLSNASNFQTIDLAENFFTGNIPTSFGLLQNLEWLNVWGNLIGAMAADDLRFVTPLTNCSKLQWLDFSYNQLGGELPNSLYNLSTQLNRLNVSYNKLTGEIPQTIKACLSLEQLYMQGNSFQGTIPDLRDLRGIQILDLSNNKLSGPIPDYLQDFSMLQNLNLSYNNLEGEVPMQGIFRNVSAFQVYNNSKLCGGIKELHLRSCPRHHSSRKPTALMLILVIGGVLLCLALISSLGCLCWVKKSRIRTNEYGIGGRASTQGDVYSFGIMLLELFTGKRPTDQMFQDDLNLHNYAKQALAGNLLQIISEIDQLKNEVKEENIWKAQTDCLISVLQIGVACSAELPINRMKMQEVVHELLSIKDKLLGDRSFDRQGVSGSNDEFSD